jgi:murein L,D-transpeptidase YcbB/YkuD
MVEKLKLFLWTIILLSVVATLGYWGVTTMQSGSEHINKQKIVELEKENERLTSELLTLEKALKEFEQEEVVPEVAEPEPTETTPPPTPTTYKNQTLIKELEKLVSDNVLIKVGSRGTRVGTIQNFLNIYSKTSYKVDNDFGSTSKNQLIKFQKDQGLSADGEAGKTTFEKMIAWLKTQG